MQKMAQIQMRLQFVVQRADTYADFRAETFAELRADVRAERFADAGA